MKSSLFRLGLCADSRVQARKRAHLQKPRRSVGLSDDLLTKLTAWKLRCPTGEHDLVFPHDSGAPLNHGILLRSGFYPALRCVKLRQIHFHDLRHTFASLLIAENLHPKRIQSLMGKFVSRWMTTGI